MEDVDFRSAVLAAFAVGAIAFELSREVVPPWRLFFSPLAALACAFTLMSDGSWLALNIAAVACGVVAGCVRGKHTTVRVDHSWRVVRLRQLYDGMAIALVIAILVGADIAPVVAFLADRMVPAPFAAAAFACAGYLLGRASAIGYRLRKTPHDDMRPGAI